MLIMQLISSEPTCPSYTAGFTRHTWPALDARRAET